MNTARLRCCLALTCLLAALPGRAADLDACVIGAPAVIRQHLGLETSIRKQGTPAGPGGSSSCQLKGSKPGQTLHVQLWRGAAAGNYYQPALYKATEFSLAGGKAFAKVETRGKSPYLSYGGNGGVLKGEVYLSVMFDAGDQAVSETQLKALLTQLAAAL